MAKFTTSTIIDSFLTFAAFNFLALFFFGVILYFTGSVDKHTAVSLLKMARGEVMALSAKEYSEYQTYKAEEKKRKELAGLQKKKYSTRSDLFDAQVKLLEGREENIRRMEKKVQIIKQQNAEQEERLDAKRAAIDRETKKNMEKITEFRQKQLSAEDEQILKRFANMEPKAVAQSLLGTNLDPQTYVLPQDQAERDKKLDYIISYLSRMNARNAAAVLAEMGPVLTNAINLRKVNRIKNLKLQN